MPPNWPIRFFGSWGAVALLPAAGLIGLEAWFRKLRHTVTTTKLLKSLERYGQAPGVAPLAGATGAVAMGGLAAFPEPVIATALQTPPLDLPLSVGSGSSSSDYSANSSSSSSSSSGCGGGSSCGG